ncbi:MAG: rod shape-determining protein MreC [Candidatus Yanofskybacteria bacterium]|nr:rod shape-determining protein MreC [Candidatus Yanofskybacteria bacterium]
MQRSATSRLLLVVSLAVVVLGNAWLFGSRLTGWAADMTGQVLAPIAQGFSRGRALLTTLAGHVPEGSDELRAREQADALRASGAREEALRREIATLRDALGIKERLTESPVEAGVFAYPREGGVRQVVVNRGTESGVARGDAVVTGQGALVGIVQEVADRHAVVRAVGDAQFEATARIVGTEVSGLVRTGSDGEITLDLVQKGESVQEGQQVVTSGDDRYPVGLVIGTVRSVDTEAATLFLTVRIAPAVSAGISGSVFVIRP